LWVHNTVPVKGIAALHTLYTQCPCSVHAVSMHLTHKYMELCVITLMWLHIHSKSMYGLEFKPKESPWYRCLVELHVQGDSLMLKKYPESPFSLLTMPHFPTITTGFSRIMIQSIKQKFQNICYSYDAVKF